MHHVQNEPADPHRHSRAQPGATFLFDAAFPLCVGLGLALWAAFTWRYSLHRSDFAQDYTAAYALRHGLPLYGAASEELTQAIVGIDGQYNFHPPTNAVLFLPFSYLPYRTAFIVWNVLELFTLLLLFRIIVEETSIPMRVAKTLGAAALLWQPFVANT